MVCMVSNKHDFMYYIISLNTVSFSPSHFILKIHKKMRENVVPKYKMFDMPQHKSFLYCTVMIRLKLLLEIPGNSLGEDSS